MKNVHKNIHRTQVHTKFHPHKCNISHYKDFVHDTGGDNPTGIWQVGHVNFGRSKLVP